MSRPNYPIPEDPVYDPNIEQLEDQDPASATQTFNPLIQRLIINTHAARKAATNIDGGSFVEPDPVEGHNSNEFSHANMTVDGASIVLNDRTATLEEHMADEIAHGNIILDGNQK